MADMEQTSSSKKKKSRRKSSRKLKVDDTDDQPDVQQQDRTENESNSMETTSSTSEQHATNKHTSEKKSKTNKSPRPAHAKKTLDDENTNNDNEQDEVQNKNTTEDNDELTKEERKKLKKKIRRKSSRKLKRQQSRLAHSFQTKPIVKPGPCEHCGNMIWGKAEQCSVCWVTLHERCKDQFAAGCEELDESDEPAEVTTAVLGEQAGEGGHEFYKKRFHLHKNPKMCNFCHDLIGGVTREGLRCENCLYICHEACLAKMQSDGTAPHNCKVTSVEHVDKSVGHHWVEAQHLACNCSLCGEEIKKHGYGCSWCRRSYHPHCKPNVSVDCDLGQFASLIVPPNAIRVKTRKDKKEYVIQMDSKLHPLLVFVNKKSGGQQGQNMIRGFKKFLNPVQIFDLGDGGPEPGLEMFRSISNQLKIMACGGDGTVGWILGVIDKLNINPSPGTIVLPLGTGNDLSRALGWGPGYTGEKIEKVLQSALETKEMNLDRWGLSVAEMINDIDLSNLAFSAEESSKDLRAQASSKQLDTDDTKQSSGRGTLRKKKKKFVAQPVDELKFGQDEPVYVMNNYFSIGVDAKVVLDFHLSREAHPERFKSRLGNKVHYTVYGSVAQLNKSDNLAKTLVLYVDDKRVDIPNGSEGLIILNLNSYMGGTDMWGHPKKEFQDQRIDDGMIEVVAVSSSAQMGMIKTKMAQPTRIAQGRGIKLIFQKKTPCQVDGEPWLQPPARVTIAPVRTGRMLIPAKGKASKNFVSQIFNPDNNSDSKSEISLEDKKT